MWLVFYTVLWILVIALVFSFIAIDFKNAFDEDDSTPTYSSFIRKWKHRSVTNTTLLWTGLVIALINPAAIYLTLHLGFEVI